MPQVMANPLSLRLSLAEVIRQHQHPVVIHASISTTTKSISKAELGLGRKLLSVEADDDWVEDVKARYNFDAVYVPSDYDPKFFASLTLNQQDTFTETQETVTHMFHRDHTLKPAIHIAVAYVILGGLCNGSKFSPAAQAAIGSLKVRPGEHPEDSLIYPDHQFAVDVVSGQRWLDTPPPSESTPRESRLLLGEDKTHRVMQSARSSIDLTVQDQSYKYPQSLKGASSAIRILTQVWSQMASSRKGGDPAAWMNKLYASSGPGEKHHCYFKLTDEDRMRKSKWYDDSDSLQNTVALLLFSLEQLYTPPNVRLLPPSESDRLAATRTNSAASPSTSGVHSLSAFSPLSIFRFLRQKMLDIIRPFFQKPILVSTPPSLQVDPMTLHVQLVRDNVPPIIFDEVAGKGATGTALRSRADKKILKFGSSDHILHEALIYDKLTRCNYLAIPQYWGVYPLQADSEQLAIILDDAGVPIDFAAMTRQQRCGLAHSIRQLHAVGVHHHDVFGNTVIDEAGTIRLIDFDQAELIPTGTTCFGCEDIDCLRVLDIEN